MEACNFYKEYIENDSFECSSYFYGDPKRKEQFKNLIKKSSWLENIPTEKDYEARNCVECNCYVYGVIELVNGIQMEYYIHLITMMLLKIEDYYAKHVLWN